MAFRFCLCSVYCLLLLATVSRNTHTHTHTHTHEWFPRFNGWVTPPLDTASSPEQVLSMAVKTEPAEQLPVHCKSARGETRTSDEMQHAGRVRLKETRPECVCVCVCVFLVSVPAKGFNPHPPNLYRHLHLKSFLPHAADINKLFIFYLLTWNRRIKTNALSCEEVCVYSCVSLCIYTCSPQPTRHLSSFISQARISDSFRYPLFKSPVCLFPRRCR